MNSFKLIIYAMIFVIQRIIAPSDPTLDLRDLYDFVQLKPCFVTISYNERALSSNSRKETRKIGRFAHTSEVETFMQRFFLGEFGCCYVVFDNGLQSHGMMNVLYLQNMNSQSSPEIRSIPAYKILPYKFTENLDLFKLIHERNQIYKQIKQVGKPLPPFIPGDFTANEITEIHEYYPILAFREKNPPVSTLKILNIFWEPTIENRSIITRPMVPWFLYCMGHEEDKIWIVTAKPFTNPPEVKLFGIQRRMGHKKFPGNARFVDFCIRGLENEDEYCHMHPKEVRDFIFRLYGQSFLKGGFSRTEQSKIRAHQDTLARMMKYQNQATFEPKEEGIAQFQKDLMHLSQVTEPPFYTVSFSNEPIKALIRNLELIKNYYESNQTAQNFSTFITGRLFPILFLATTEEEFAKRLTDVIIKLLLTGLYIAESLIHTSTVRDDLIALLFETIPDAVSHLDIQFLLPKELPNFDSQIAEVVAAQETVQRTLSKLQNYEIIHARLDDIDRRISAIENKPISGISSALHTPRVHQALDSEAAGPSNGPKILNLLSLIPTTITPENSNTQHFVLSGSASEVSNESQSRRASRDMSSHQSPRDMLRTNSN